MRMQAAVQSSGAYPSTRAPCAERTPPPCITWRRGICREIMDKKANMVRAAAAAAGGGAPACAPARGLQQQLNCGLP